ncbi:ATP synthase subunit I [Clostridium sp. 19966]|uniref:ATP synthase subunit I n=1 Tax=Clostridium sp. 19966 TaxID=2768166 RepID=UPI0028DF95F4|nr:ATP synthase subunit I [Clostridium sp. 19966]MDT8715591.1 ATP synthase subunit I [Clostridium sp. 19966]
MDKDIKNMLRKVIIIDLIIGIVQSAAIQFVFNSYGLIVFLGVAVAVFNFVINAAASEFILTKIKISPMVLFLVGFTFRIIFAAVIGFVVYTYNKYNAAAYLFGYTSYFIGVIIYSSSLANLEGK